MFNLIKNEYFKIFYKKSNYIVLILCLALGIFLDFMFSMSVHDYTYYEDYTVEDELNNFKDYEDLSSMVEYKTLEIYDKLGLTYCYEATNSWYHYATNTLIYNHLIYVYYDELVSKDIYEYYYNDMIPSQTKLKNGNLSKDIDFAKRMEDAIIEKDFKKFCDIALEAAEYDRKNEYYSYSEDEYFYYDYIYKNNINPNEYDNFGKNFSAFTKAKSEYDNLVLSKENGMSVSDKVLEEAEQKYNLCKYAFENDIAYHLTEFDNPNEYSENTFIICMLQSGLMCSMAGIIIVVIAAGIFSSEFHQGTIKFLLINPIKRSKIFWSKYITCISLLIFIALAFFGIHLLTSVLFCGMDGIDGVYLTISDNIVGSEPIIFYAFKRYLLSGVSIITSVTMAFTISSFIKNSGLAIALSLVCEFLGGTIVMFLNAFNQDWARYLFFANTDLSNIASGNSMFAGHTLTFALTILAVYMVVFLLTAYDSFTRKDV